jgi:CheY-like chemotaxis protein
MDRILVVDDEIETCNLLSEFLSRKKYDVSIATSGQEAISKIKSNRPEVVLLDIRMPGMDGIQVLRRIKQMDNNIDVIMITAVNEERVGREAIKLGAFDYITKPISLNYLDTSILVRLFTKKR